VVQVKNILFSLTTKYNLDWYKSVPRKKLLRRTPKTNPEHKREVKKKYRKMANAKRAVQKVVQFTFFISVASVQERRLNF
jgi:hypothetical protein